MKITDKYKIPYSISKIILQQSGKFTLKDIVDKIPLEIKTCFTSSSQMQNYVKTKLVTMCEYGLIGRTGVYYFSV